MIVTQGPIEAALAYAERVGNTMTWYSTADSPFGADVDAPPGGGFAMNVFLRDGETVYRTWHTTGRGVEQLTYTFALVDVLPYGRQEEWQDSPEGWPQAADLQRLARLARRRPVVRSRDLNGRPPAPAVAAPAAAADVIPDRVVFEQVIDALVQGSG